jgi:hypothetical protein
MSISTGKRFLNRSAVAALAVAGVLGVLVGMGWAVLPNSSTGKTQSMSATWTVANITELDATPNNPGGDELLKKVDFVGSSNFGTLGTLRVRTNSTAWDINMKTNNGGKLADTSSGNWVDSCQTDWLTGAVLQNTCKKVQTGSLKYLTRDSVGGNPVVLKVAIGVAKTGKALNAGTQSEIYPIFYDQNAFVKPIVLADSVIKKSDSVAISFAQTIGDSVAMASGFSGSSGVKFKFGIYGDETTGNERSSWKNIRENGFPKPRGNYNDNDEFFYVNVGIDSTEKYPIAGNKNGTYKETFYFDLMANF